MSLFGRIKNTLFGSQATATKGAACPLDEQGLAEKGYDKLPTSMQWSPGSQRQVDKSGWKPCNRCGRPIPMSEDGGFGPDDRWVRPGTNTYVCPYCGHCHVGAADWSKDAQAQERCHECGTELGEMIQCPKCAYPRGWVRVQCPHCGNHQPVHAPHLARSCDMFYLQCVQCESVYESLCIC